MGSDNDDKDTESDEDNNIEHNDNKPSDLVAATDSDGNKPVKNEGVQRSRRRGKGVTKKYSNYSMLMAARQARRGGPHRALICKGCIFFSADNLSNAKPIPEEDKEKFTLRVALVHYSMNGSIKKFETKGKAGVTKELTRMHAISVFHPIKVESLTYDEQKKAHLSLMFLKKKRDSLVKARMCFMGASKRMAPGQNKRLCC